MAPKNTTLLLQKLRNLMKTCVNPEINAYIVPSCDAHMSEYISEWDSRRAYICGFTGSAGTVIVTEQHACLWTDGRYYLQAANQLDSNWQLMKDGMPDTPSQGNWLCSILQPNARVGFDPFLMSHVAWNSLKEDLSINQIKLIPIYQNLIDLVWDNKKPRILTPPFVQPIEYTGLSWQDKIARLRKIMQRENATAIVVSMLDEVAWLLNLRGSDIQFNPLFLAYIIITHDFVILFTDNALTNVVCEHLFSNASVRVVHKIYSSILQELQLIVENIDTNKIWVTNKTNRAIIDIIPEVKRLFKHSPIEIMKAVKTPVELQGMKNCHIRDAVALCRFFSWLENEILNREISEIEAAEYSEQMRRENEKYVSLSFDTISSVGSNASIIHYKPSPETNKIINTHEIFLFDSGAQYLDGTTDITRTIHLGTPTAYEKECFTQVLKGHISLDTIIFPNGTKGIFLDSFARQHLWSLGLEYRHGTGHGVGSFLNVHEGPCGIGIRIRPEDIPLEEGMVLSNEPGYYDDGKFGIRIENLVYVVPTDTKYNYQSIGFLTFEDLALVPIQTKLIDKSLLTHKEIEWLNLYHKKCMDVIGPELQKKGHNDAYEWLIRETQQI